MKCTIAMSVFRNSPFSLLPGQLIEVQVVATNGNGNSVASTLNTEGAIVQTIPQTAPVLSRGSLTAASLV